MVPAIHEKGRFMDQGRSMYSVAAIVLLFASPAPAQESMPARAAVQPPTVFSDEIRDGGHGPEMVVLPAGSYRMGCISELDCFDDQKPVHQVTISEAFAVSRFEITFEDYERFADPDALDDEGWGRGRRPAVNVSWSDAKQYVAWLSSQSGQTYRLLTEAEWEYACRAGSATRYHFGSSRIAIVRLCECLGHRSRQFGRILFGRRGYADG